MSEQNTSEADETSADHGSGGAGTDGSCGPDDEMPHDTRDDESSDAGDDTDDTLEPDEVISADDDDGTETETPSGEEFDAEVDDALRERVSESDPEAIAQELASLRVRIDDLESELDARKSAVDDLNAKLTRKQADFQNYKKRMKQRREEERKRATADLVTRLLDVRDNLVRALDQDEDTDIRGGVESTLRQFDDELAEEDVEVIEPEAGDDVDPHRHEVLVRVDSDQSTGTIAAVHRPGYLMADTVLREAQVTVSDGANDQ